MRKLLTTVFVAQLKPPATGRLEVSDTRCSGLSFRLTCNGVASWSYRYRDVESGRSQRFRIGTYPDVPLKDARAAADKLRAGVSAGLNPMVQKRLERVERTERSFGALATRYMEGHAKVKKRSWPEDARLLRRHVLPQWEHRRADAISRQDVIALLDAIVASGAPVEANRCQSLVSTIFSFAIDEGSVNAHPSAGLKARGGAETPRSRVLSADEIATFWPEIVKSPVSRVTGLCLRLALLTAMRASEVSGVHRSEIIGLDSSEPYILVPEVRVKTKQTLLVPLTGLALEVVQEALSLTSSEWLFTGRWHDKPVAAHTLAVAMENFSAAHGGTWTACPATPHDLRRSVRSGLAELKIPDAHAMRVLGHKPRDVDAKHYNLYHYHSEKRAALAAWSDRVSGIISGK
jgi:integrase